MEPNHGPYRTRSYQQEMFERSMKENTIVVMDTGSGKTQVAILRIKALLDTCPEHKRVWFLAPTVDLCTQQHRVLSEALPAYCHRLLTGADNVDRWSEQKIWDAALDQQRVVVSTHAVLVDALRHGFVQISELAMIVFDEAHHCAKNHPANVIMRDFYHPAKSSYGPASVPHILGLSASLIQKSNLKYVQTIEENLDAVGVTPRRHRQDLLRYVHRPKCQLLLYDPSHGQTSQPESESLNQPRHLSLTANPWPRPVARDLLSGPIFSRLSLAQSPPESCHETIKKFCKKAQNIYENLGSWAADYYIDQTLNALEKTDDIYQNLFDDQPTSRQSLEQIFRQSNIKTKSHHQEDPAPHNTSSKVQCLISFLLDEVPDKPSGIIFVQQRATTAVLSALLQQHPQTKEKFLCAPMVGVSNISGRKYGLSELIDLKAQRETLSNFRNGSCNLVIATNVLEEGIDVQACNMVVCFDPPPNVKSFIQRRGRARHIRSRLAIMQSVTEDIEVVRKWEKLEEELSKICQQDRQRASLTRHLEDQDEHQNYRLTVASTGAQLGPVPALQHLYHFCSKLPHRPYTDFRPDFQYREVESGLIQATVILPNFVKSHVRKAVSAQAWRTERAAKVDAAFQAYSALYKASLLNDNLLPLSHDWISASELTDQVETGDSPAQFDIWSEITDPTHSLIWHRTTITVNPPEILRKAGESAKIFSLIAPKEFHNIPQLLLHWAPRQTFTVSFGPSFEALEVDDNQLGVLRDATMLLYSSVRSERLRYCNTDFITQFKPSLAMEDLKEWTQTYSQRISGDSLVGKSPKSLVRVPYPNSPPYMFHKWSSLGENAMMTCERISKRRNFLAPFSQTTSVPLTVAPRLEDFPATECYFEGPPFPWARIGLFMPIILQHLADTVIADRLQAEVLTRVPFRNRQHLLTALCAPSARRLDNYQRFEFLGDTVLKYITTCHLFVSEPDWHEGYLTQKRAQLVSNAALAKASIMKGLPPYIITEEINYKDWMIPTFTSAKVPSNARKISGKTLADIVEAVIGATWVDSGITAATKCINIFLPMIPQNPTNFPRPKESYPSDSNLLSRVQSLIGYNFIDTILLQEALTHPSCGGHSRTDSYQRLEYLGDAILDMLVAEYLSQRTLSPGRMTHLKAALVNSHLLGFFCLNLREYTDHRSTRSSRDGSTEVSTEKRAVHLASFMSSTSSDLDAARTASEHRYDNLGNFILQQIQSSAKYPWSDLIRLRPEKFFSDIIESLLGAIFVDASGNLRPCSEFLKKLGLHAYMEYLVEQNVDVLSPRERVQRLVGSEAVEYEIRKQDLGNLFRCRLLVSEHCVAEVDDCIDNDEAIALVVTKFEESRLSSSASQMAETE